MLPLHSAANVGSKRVAPDARTMTPPVDVFAKVRNHDRAEQLEAAKEGDLLPYFRILESQAGPVVEMEGRETIMLGSNNYLGLTTDERVKQARPRRARGLRHRGHRLAPAERHHPAAPRARARAGRVDGDRGRDRLHHRLPVEPGGDQRDPRARRHRDLRLGRPRLDPRRLQALRRPPAPLPPQPDGQARDDARASRGRRAAAPWWSSTASSRWRATSATCRRSSSSPGATAPA